MSFLPPPMVASPIASRSFLPASALFPPADEDEAGAGAALGTRRGKEVAGASSPVSEEGTRPSASLTSRGSTSRSSRSAKSRRGWYSPFALLPAKKA